MQQERFTGPALEEFEKLDRDQQIQVLMASERLDPQWVSVLQQQIVLATHHAKLDVLMLDGSSLGWRLDLALNPGDVIELRVKRKKPC